MQGQIEQIRLAFGCGLPSSGVVTLADLAFSTIPPEFVLLTPAGIVGDTIGNPIYSWTALADIDFYAIYVAPTDDLFNPALHVTVPAAQYCADNVCSMDGTTFTESAWLTNGNYSVFLSIMQNGVFGEWIGPYDFQLDSPKPDIGTNVGITGTNATSRPTFNWTLEARAQYATWFRLYAASTDNPTQPILDEWFKRADTCGSSIGTICSWQSTTDFFNEIEYVLYIHSWGPGGFSDGGTAGWAGPITFEPTVPPPGLVSNLTALVSSPNQPQLTLSWSPAPYATWYQVWIGTLDPLETTYLEWHDLTDSNCLTGICTMELEPSWDPRFV